MNVQHRMKLRRIAAQVLHSANDNQERETLIKQARELGITPLVATWKTETIRKHIKEKTNA